jgi:hypothetical protein
VNQINSCAIESTPILLFFQYNSSKITSLETPILLPVYGMAVVVFGRAVQDPFIQPIRENMTALVQEAHVLDKRFNYAPCGRVVKGISVKGFIQRSLTWIPKPGALKLTDATCKVIFNHWMQILVVNKLITAVKVTTLHQMQGYSIVPLWNHVISCKDFNELYTVSYLLSAHTLVNPAADMVYNNFKSCCHYNNNNTLFSFFQPGEVAKVFLFLKQYPLRNYITTDDQALYSVGSRFGSQSHCSET